MPDSKVSAPPYKLKARTNVLIIRSTYHESARQVEEEFQAAKTLLERAGVRYDVVEVSGALEIPQAVNRHSRQRIFPFRRAWDGYLVLGGILGDRPDQIANRSSVISELTKMNTERLLNIGNGIMSNLKTEENPKGEHTTSGWGEMAANAALKQIESAQRTPRFRFGKPKAQNSHG